MTKQRGTTALLPAATLVMAWLFAPPVAYAAVAGASFDHLTTGFELTGAHRVVPCESCHVDAVFRGTPRRCESGHVIGSRISATAKPADHVMSNNDCGRCHTTTAWSPSLRYDHSDVSGRCASCHNANGWSFWQFDHATLTKFPLTGAHERLGCRDCHRDAEPKSTTAGECVSCHQADDVHEGQFGRDCGRCHGTRAFRQLLTH